MDDYKQGMIDGLELALILCEHCSDISKVINDINYYLRLIKSYKFEKIKYELGAFR